MRDVTVNSDNRTFSLACLLFSRYATGSEIQVILALSFLEERRIGSTQTGRIAYQEAGASDHEPKRYSFTQI